MIEDRPEPPTEVWVDILTTQNVVEVGLRNILQDAGPSAPFAIRIGSEAGEPDVVLYDVIKFEVEDGKDLDYWLLHTASTVIVIDRALKPELGTNARDRGAEWAISLDVTAKDLIAVIAEAVSGTLPDSIIAQEWEVSDWPGQEVGLSSRESDLLRRIVLGHTNLEIAQELFLSINSIKTYVRSAYRKIGARDRGAAVAWAIKHGFPTRTDQD